MLAAVGRSPSCSARDDRPRRRANPPRWLHSLCRHIAPASFAALAASELFIHAARWFRLAAPAVGGPGGGGGGAPANVLATIAVGMAALHLF